LLRLLLPLNYKIRTNFIRKNHCWLFRDKSPYRMSWSLTSKLNR